MKINLEINAFGVAMSLVLLLLAWLGRPPDYWPEYFVDFVRLLMMLLMITLWVLSIKFNISNKE